MPFLNFVALLLLLAGPVVGFWVAMHLPNRKRWKVVLWSAAGGASASILFIVVLLLTDLLPSSPTRVLLRTALTSAGFYALFGLVLGIATLVPRTARMPRVVVTGLAMIGLLALIRMGIDKATHRPPTRGASGIVFGPDSAPAAGVPVFLDRGSGPVERLTTDRTGLFITARGRPGAPQPLLLICVPGAVPYVARPIEYLLTPERYHVPALEPRSIVAPGIRALGWKRPIPRECWGNSVDQEVTQ